MYIKNPLIFKNLDRNANPRHREKSYQNLVCFQDFHVAKIFSLISLHVPTYRIKMFMGNASSGESNERTELEIAMADLSKTEWL